MIESLTKPKTVMSWHPVALDMKRKKFNLIGYQSTSKEEFNCGWGKSLIALQSVPIPENQSI